MVACFALVWWEKVGDSLSFLSLVGGGGSACPRDVEPFARATPWVGSKDRKHTRLMQKGG